jgi:hypothetical protein
MRPGRVWALGAFAFRTNLRRWTTRGGAAAGLAVLVLGPLISVVAGRRWEVDRSLAFYGFVVALLFGLRSGLAEEREGDLDVFLTHNLVSRAEHTGAMVLSLLLTWSLFLAGTFGAIALVSGDIGFAVWSTTSWGMRSAIPMGLVLGIEQISTFRLPLVLPVFGYLFVLVVSTVLIGEERALDWFVVTDRSDPSTLIPLGVQALIVSVIGLGGSLAVAALRGGRPGRRGVVPSSHGGAPGTE